MTSLTDLHDHQARRPTATTTGTGAGGIRQRGRAATGTARERELELEREIRRRRQFAANASHELRNPLTGLRTELEEARLHPDQTDLPDLIERTLKNLDRLDSIVTDLLLLSRAETGLPDELQHFDLAALARTEATRRTDRVTVQLHLEPHVIVNAVPSHLTRILTNLLDNAQRHADQTVHLRVRRHHDGAELTVTDDGEGIDPADRERIFQRFTRLGTPRTRDQRGAGLGLAISRDIAHAHGGTLQVGTSPTGGARFTLRLPLSRTSPPTGSALPAAI
ncbi:sensor histidine kinase [Actinomadura scrupuli]|uniref:sensor histidine kinase n=1 Tax=Actinomadura scrupuli TaxID=559629 RepID=UPI003D96A5B0